MINGRVYLSEDIEVKDISLSGIRFYTSKFVSPGMNCTLTLRFRDRSLALKGTVVRALLSGTRREGDDFIPVFDVAMAFEDLGEQTRQDLSEILEEIEGEGRS